MSVLRKAIVSQFRRPTGPVGALAGHIMATRPSNRERNEWTVGLLDPKPGDAILEIGCGPGLGLANASNRAPGVELTGLDHSRVMLAQARRRLDGYAKAELVAGGEERLADWPKRFDAIFSVNVVQFLADIDASFSLIHAALKPGGSAVTTYQPRHKNPTAGDARGMADRIAEAMEKAGFAAIERHELPLEPVMAIAVTGIRPERPGR